MMRFPEPATEQKASSSFANLLSIFLGVSSSEPKPKRSFDAEGVVGLGIVAAMSAEMTRLAAEPIAIGAAARCRAREEDELSESYTCVITHVAGAGEGGGSVRKRVYFGFDDGGGGWFVEACEEAPAREADFLSRCCLCSKRLDGLDIYMYRYLPGYTSFLPNHDDQYSEAEKKYNRKRLLKDWIFSQLSYLAIFVVLICITEREALTIDPLNFNVFSILFEVVSAYGNVGFSVGYSCKRLLKQDVYCKDASYGFVGKWSDKGKLILIIVMVFGRLKAFNLKGGRAWKLR